MGRVDDPSELDYRTARSLGSGSLHAVGSDGNDKWTLAATLAVPDVGSPTGWKAHQVWRNDSVISPREWGFGA